MTAKSQVQALLLIISQAAQDALAEYEKYGEEVPPLDSVDPHPLDEETNQVDLKKIIRKLEGACEQLCSTLAPPTHTLVNVSSISNRMGTHAISFLPAGSRLRLGLPEGCRREPCRGRTSGLPQWIARTGNFQCCSHRTGQTSNCVKTPCHQTLLPRRCVLLPR